MSGRTQIYMSHSREASSDQVYIPAMGVHERMPPGLIEHGGPGSRHPCLIMIFHSHAGLLAPNRQDWLLAASHLVVWPFEAGHRYGNCDETWNHSWMHVSGRWIDHMLRQTSVPLGVPISLDEKVALRHMEMISGELRGSVRQDPDMLEGMLQVFWREVERHFRTNEIRRRADSRLERARLFIEASFDRPFRLAEAAGQAHLSPSHFCILFSRQFGVPPREYAMRLRLQRGAQLLANRDLAIFEVAEMTGCPDALYFSRLFRKRYGMSPMQFRRQLHAE
ncbi:MAG: AraC family transcriptional regulator [Methylacidiphilales bacterium]|nr:AraC family transcriptional regulator [Candidatus Methylacidiphilales bacterium]